MATSCNGQETLTGLLFKPQYINFDENETLKELQNVPKHWDKYYRSTDYKLYSRNDEEYDYFSCNKKMYLRNKFYAASGVPMYSNHVPGNPPIPFVPEPFIDRINNICLFITYDDKEFPLKIKKRFGNRCISEIYRNSDKKIDIPSYFNLKYQNEYIAIFRVPYSHFVSNYHHSFHEFLLDKKIQLFGELLPNESRAVHSYGVIQAFENFFIQKVEPFGSQVINCKDEYDIAFRLYCVDYGYGGDIIHLLPFVVLWELFDIKRRQKTFESIQYSLDIIGKKLEKCIESNVTKIIISYLHFGCVQPYTFSDFFQEQIALKLNYLFQYKKLGKYTNIYEWENWKKSKTFCVNPLKYKLLSDEQLQMVNAHLEEKYQEWSKRKSNTFVDSWESVMQSVN
eukprot:261154_1